MNYNQNQQQYGQAQGYYNQPSPQPPGNIHYGQQQQQYNPPAPQGYYQPQEPMYVQQQQPTQNRDGMGGGCMACLSGLLCCCLADECCSLIC